MNAARRRANRAARKRIRARDRVIRLVITAAATTGPRPDPWQLAYVATIVAGPDPRIERRLRHEALHPTPRHR